jgi:hypothetical protein
MSHWVLLAATVTGLWARLFITYCWQLAALLASPIATTATAMAMAIATALAAVISNNK